MFYPMVMVPYLVEKEWGGMELTYIKNGIGESWEVSGVDGKSSSVMNGELAGESLDFLYSEFRREILGEVGDRYDRFPVVVKYIDANEPLSVQVHPRGMDESWYVVKERGGKVGIGMKRGMSKDEFIRVVEEGRVVEEMMVIDVKEGESYYVPGGTAHVILGGVCIYEVKRNEGCTYRLYDWGREREVQVALGVREVEVGEVRLGYRVDSIEIERNERYRRRVVGGCTGYVMEEVEFYKGGVMEVGEMMGAMIITSLANNLLIEYDGGKVEEVKERRTVLVPYVLGRIRVIGVSGSRVISTVIM